MNEREPRAWVLNLDAESELGAALRYAPTAHLRAIVGRERARLVDSLLRPGDVLVTEEQLARVPQLAAGLAGMAWSPTPTALALLRRAGARLQAAPSLEVLRAVNARPLAAAVRAPLVGASFAKHVAASLDETLALLARPTPLGWLVRRTFGAAGRGRRRIAAGRPRADECAWIEASLRMGPLVVEPWVEVLLEHTRSGWVARDGAVTISRPCIQKVAEHGAWLGTERAERGALSRQDDDALAAAFESAGRALAARGYFGPFGIDAYHHRALDGSRRAVLNPLSEINARFTMDWATAMSDARAPQLALERLDALA